MISVEDDLECPTPVKRTRLRLSPGIGPKQQHPVPQIPVPTPHNFYWTPPRPHSISIISKRCWCDNWTLSTMFSLYEKKKKIKKLHFWTCKTPKLSYTNSYRFSIDKLWNDHHGLYFHARCFFNLFSAYNYYQKALKVEIQFSGYLILWPFNFHGPQKIILTWTKWPNWNY